MREACVVKLLKLSYMNILWVPQNYRITFYVILSSMWNSLKAQRICSSCLRVQSINKRLKSSFPGSREGCVYVYDFIMQMLSNYISSYSCNFIRFALDFTYFYELKFYMKITEASKGHRIFFSDRLHSTHASPNDFTFETFILAENRRSHSI